MITWLQGQVIENKQWCPSLYSLTIKTESLAFKAGQFVLIGLEVDGDIIYRPYSLINIPGSPLLEIHFNTVKDGKFSPHLTKLKAGDAIQIANRTSGLLTLDEAPATPHLWLFATGTGIGPFISILHTDEPWLRYQKIVLCYSVKTREGLAYHADFESLSARYPNQFCYIPFVTREQVPNAVYDRMTVYLKSGELEQHAKLKLSADTSHVMLCGNSNMLADVTALLEHKGLHRHSRREPGHIATEKYY
tara:strand:+ start:1034 stop:1777 length:744 start_codon:yes stop_codon:yes gene_type:complete